MLYWLEPQLQPLVGGYEAFDRLMSMNGETFRKERGRETLRVEIGHKGYFVKRHFGPGWIEIAKNLCSLRLPVLGAANEWRAIQRLDELGLSTMSLVGLGQRGWNPARLESFILTEELPNSISLEDLLKGQGPLSGLAARPRMRLKRQLIEQLANIAKTLHENGLNHRDFYLCHFHLDQKSLDQVEKKGALKLYLIDLHRMQLRKKTPVRWRLKDVAGLYHSALDAGLSRNDCLSFIRTYGGRGLRAELSARGGFWRKVSTKAKRLYHKAHGRLPVMPNVRLGL